VHGHGELGRQHDVVTAGYFRSAADDYAKRGRLPEDGLGGVIVERPRPVMRPGAEAHAAQGDVADLQARGSEVCDLSPWAVHRSADR
jgi:hypothetical protein